MSPYKGRFDLLLQKRAVSLDFAEGISHHLMAAVFTNRIEIKDRGKNSFFLSGDEEPVVAASIMIPDDGTESTGASLFHSGRIGHCDSRHVFVGAGGDHVDAVLHFRAVVGHQNDFCPLQHQNAGAFGIFPVVADHDADFYAVKFSHKKFISAFQHSFAGKITCMHFMVGQQDFAAASNEPGGVSRSSEPSGEACDNDSHVKLLCFFPEGKQMRIVLFQGGRGPYLKSFGFLDISDGNVVVKIRKFVARDPALGKQNQVGSQCLGLLLSLIHI